MKYFKTEDIYNYFHRVRTFSTRGIYPARIKNWDAIYKKEDWQYFQRFHNKIIQSGYQIDYKKFIDALFDFSKGQWVNANQLLSVRAVTIYKNYLKKIEEDTDPENIKKQIIASVKFVTRFCKAQNITCFSDYFYHNCNTFPTIITHFNSGVICRAFFELIPNVTKKIKAFPEDIVHDYLKDKMNEFETNRLIHIKRSPWIAKFAKNFEEVLDRNISKND